jgi:hypothetical protein
MPSLTQAALTAALEAIRELHTQSDDVRQRSDAVCAQARAMTVHHAPVYQHRRATDRGQADGTGWHAHHRTTVCAQVERTSWHQHRRATDGAPPQRHQWQHRRATDEPSLVSTITQC